MTRVFQGFAWGPGSGVTLGENVRVQRLRCLTAERPNASIRIGDHAVIYENADLAAYGDGRIEIGDCAVLGDIRIAARFSVKIGRRFISSWNVFIQDFDPHPIDPALRGRQIEAICAGFRPTYSKAPYPEKLDWAFPGAAVEIGDDAWIGAGATLLKGVRIGNGCIVAAGTVVIAGEYPNGSIIAGNPGKIVKQLTI